MWRVTAPSRPCMGKACRMGIEIVRGERVMVVGERPRQPRSGKRFLYCDSRPNELLEKLLIIFYGSRFLPDVCRNVSHFSWRKVTKVRSSVLQRTESRARQWQDCSHTTDYRYVNQFIDKIIYVRPFDDRRVGSHAGLCLCWCAPSNRNNRIDWAQSNWFSILKFHNLIEIIGPIVWIDRDQRWFDGIHVRSIDGVLSKTCFPNNEKKMIFFDGEGNINETNMDVELSSMSMDDDDVIQRISLKSLCPGHKRNTSDEWLRIIPLENAHNIRQNSTKHEQWQHEWLGLRRSLVHFSQLKIYIYSGALHKSWKCWPFASSSWILWNENCSFLFIIAFV